MENKYNTHEWKKVHEMRKQEIGHEKKRHKETNKQTKKQGEL